MIRKIGIFCGSSSGNTPEYIEVAEAVGKAIAERNFGIVYGGAKIGLMGALANAALSKRGKVYGVIPNFLDSPEVSHEGLTELIHVQSMHQRKTIMSGMADAFIALPGGIGTLEELFEAYTWLQLNIMKKPVALFNFQGFFDPTLLQLKQMKEKGFLSEQSYQDLIIGNTVEEIMDKFIDFTKTRSFDPKKI